MAIYEYEILGPDGEARGIYEVEQRMSDPVLTKHPETGEPLRRILSSTFAHGSSPSGGPGEDFGGCASGACGSGADFGPSGCAGGTCGWN